MDFVLNHDLPTDEMLSKFPYFFGTISILCIMQIIEL